MKKKKLFFSLASILFFGFLFFTFLVSKNIFNGLDLQTTRFLQGIIPRFLDVPFSVFSLFGSLEFVSIILLFLWAKSKRLSYIYVLISFGIFHVVEILGKLFIHHLNPPLQFFRYSIPFSFPTSEVNTGFSFPSGHMGRTMFIFIIFAFMIFNAKKLSVFQKKILYCFAVLIIVLMFISRIYLGEHWLSDIIGGGILGISFGILSFVFL